MSNYLHLISLVMNFAISKSDGDSLSSKLFMSTVGEMKLRKNNTK